MAFKKGLLGRLNLGLYKKCNHTSFHLGVLELAFELVTQSNVWICLVHVHDLALVFIRVDIPLAY